MNKCMQNTDTDNMLSQYICTPLEQLFNAAGSPLVSGDANDPNSTSVQHPST